jgi:chemotaxis protein MotB
MGMDKTMTPLTDNPFKTIRFQKKSNALRLLKETQEPANSNEIWLITLSDLLMLLMIFFVFLLAIPLLEHNKTAQAQPKPAPVEQAKPVTPPADISLSKNVDTADKQAIVALENDLLGVLDNREGPQGVTVERRSQHIVLTFPEQIIFDSAQAQLKTAVSPTLEKVAAFIISHPELSVEVQGHTDDRPIKTSRYPSNWELSADRATQVARTLVQLGANPTKIATKGLGEYHPIQPNTSDASRLKNRRVEIQFSLLQS